MRGKETQRAVTPVVLQPPGDHEVIVDMLVDRQELDRSDAKRLEVVDDCWMASTEVRPTQFFRHIRMTFRQALDVGFVDDRFQQRGARKFITLPIELTVDHD